MHTKRTGTNWLLTRIIHHPFATEGSRNVFVSTVRTRDRGQWRSTSLPCAASLATALVLGLVACQPSPLAALASHETLLHEAAGRHGELGPVPDRRYRVVTVTKEQAADVRRRGYLLDHDGGEHYFSVEPARPEPVSAALLDFISASERVGRLSPDQWQALHDQLSFEQRLNLALALRSPYPLTPPEIVDRERLPAEIVSALQTIYAGRAFTPAMHLQRANGYKAARKFTNSDLALLLDRIDRHVAGGSASFDHDSMQPVYHDPELEQIVRILFEDLFLSDQARVRQIATEAPEIYARLTTDRSTANDLSRLEPANLLANILVRDFLQRDIRLQRFDIPPLTLASIARYRYRNLLGMSAEPRALPAGVFHASDGGQQLLAVCATKAESSETWARTESGMSWLLLPPETDQLEFSCAGADFRMAVHRDRKPRTTSAAISSRFRNDPLSAVVTFAITDGISSDMLDNFFTLFSYITGCRMLEQSTILAAVGEHLLADLAKADLYFPVAHQLHTGAIPVSHGGDMLRVRFKDCGDLNVDVVFYAPLMNENLIAKHKPPEVFNRSDLTRLFKSRREQARDQLFIMNLSCRSEMAVPGWLAAYYASQPASIDPVPLVIASRRGYSVTGETIGGFIRYGLGVIQALRKGAGTDDIHHLLSDSKIIPGGFDPVTSWDDHISEVLEFRQISLKSNDWDLYF